MVAAFLAVQPGGWKSRSPREAEFRGPVPSGTRRIFLRSGLAALLVAGLCLSSCSVLLVAPYDETTDRLLTDLSVKTETAIARADAHTLSPEERGAFFDEAIGVIRTMKARSSLVAKNEDEVAALITVEQCYQALRQRNVSPRSSVASAVRLSLVDLQQIQIAKKRSSIFGSGLKKTKSTT